MAEKEIILRIEDLSKSFSRKVIDIGGEQHTERYHVIYKCDLLVKRGIVNALIGGNGAGKTTLFNIISRFLEPDYGSITFSNGTDINLLTKSSYQIERLGIGRHFQDNHIFPEMTVLENMLIADEKMYGENPLTSLFSPQKVEKIDLEREQEVFQIFQDLFGKDNYFWKSRNNYASSLSFGQQRLLGLARLFMAEHKLVLLDEPTSGVNPKYIRTIAEIIQKMTKEQGLTVLLIEHNMDFVLKVSEWCNFMNDGEIQIFGYPSDIINNPEVQETYFGL